MESLQSWPYCGINLFQIYTLLFPSVEVDLNLDPDTKLRTIVTIFGTDVNLGLVDLLKGSELKSHRDPQINMAPNGT